MATDQTTWELKVNHSFCIVVSTSTSTVVLWWPLWVKLDVESLLCFLLCWEKQKNLEDKFTSRLDLALLVFVCKITSS